MPFIFALEPLSFKYSVRSIESLKSMRAQEIVIVLRNRPQLRILRQVLQIRFHDRGAWRQKFNHVYSRARSRGPPPDPWWRAEPDSTALAATGCGFCGVAADC